MFQLLNLYNATMAYIKILVADPSYHGQEALTYQSSQPLQIGTIVTIPLRSKEILGIVIGQSQKPTFKLKSIIAKAETPVLPLQKLELLQWMRQYYPAPLGIITQLFLPRSLPKNIENIKTPSQESMRSVHNLPPLTKDQQIALSHLQNQGLHILHGETGTGKTRIYIEIAKKTLLSGKSSIILTPEIGLTSQLANDFRLVFGNEIVKIIHSQLTPKTRQNLWTEILVSKQPLIIIGPRSALFAPLANVGFIAVDESHETAYKQDQAPHYHASTVAAKLAELHQALLILGSATPLVADYYIARAKNRPIIYMSQTAVSTSPGTAEISIVDLKDRTAFNTSQHLSDTLITGVKKALHAGEQSLIFLNRRGTSRVIFCDHCGWQNLCPHCDLPVIYHGDSHIVRCHSCSYTAPPPTFCPDCKNPSIVFSSVGTKAITEEVERLFPGVKIQRFDTDNKKSERLEEQYAAVRSGKVEILVGTQTLAKGLDLPKLGFVGIINAETSLSFPDFSATERTYQLLGQVLGRIGRGHRATQAVIQTYSPNSSVLEAAIHKKWDIFYDKELAERARFVFPPFCYMLKLVCKRKSSDSAERAAEALYKKLVIAFPNLIIEGPMAAFREKVSNHFQWQIVVKSKTRADLLVVVKKLPANWLYIIDPLNLL